MRRIGRLRRRKLNRIIVLSAFCLLFVAFCLLFVITAGYAAFSTNISLHVKGNILEGTRVIQEWDENSQTDFHSDFYKQNIVSITFLNNNNVPENAVESWNVSEDKEKGTVKAWVVPNSSDSSKYDLYIGAKGKVIANENSGYVFYDFRGVKEINFDNNYDTSNAVDMSKMFLNCTNLQTLDLSSFDTSNVTSMYGMFCMWDTNINYFPTNNLLNITFGPNFNTSNVTDMQSMFAGLSELKELDVSNFNTSNVTTMYHMFYGCQSLETLDVSNFDTSKVTNMENMFAQCKNLSELDVSNFDTSKVINMKNMFNMWDDKINACSNNNLKLLNLSNFDTSRVTDMSGMFSCSDVSEIKGLQNFNTNNVINMGRMFFECKNITMLNLCSFNTSNVTYMLGMFYDTYSLKNIYVGSNWIITNADTRDMFAGSGVSSVTTGQC